MEKFTLKIEERKLKGRKVKSLRREGVLPGNIFGNKIKSKEMQVALKEFDAIYKKAGETGVVELVLGSDKRPVLIHNVQKDPVSGNFLHVDFLQVDLTKKVTAQVPVEMVNESPAEKQGIGTVVQYVNEIEVEALPTDLPDKFEVDISNLSEVDQSFLVKDLNVDRNKVEIKQDLEEIVAKVEPPKEEKIEEVPVEVEGEAGTEATQETSTPEEETPGDTVNKKE